MIKDPPLPRMQHSDLRCNDTCLGEFSEMMEQFFVYALQESGEYQGELFRLGDCLYARGDHDQRRFAVGFYSGWMAAWRE